MTSAMTASAGVAGSRLERKGVTRRKREENRTANSLNILDSTHVRDLKIKKETLLKNKASTPLMSDDSNSSKGARKDVGDFDSKTLFSFKTASRPTTESTISTCSGGSYMGVPATLQAARGEGQAACGESQGKQCEQSQPQHSRLKAAAIAWVEERNSQEDKLQQEGAKLESQHDLRRQRHEEDFANAISNFDDHWKQCMTEFDEYQEEALNSFIENQRELHKHHMESVRAELEPHHPKWSAECLRLLRSTMLLEKQQRFVEAELREQKAKSLQAKEQAAFDQLREKKICKTEENFLQRQERSLTYFQERQTAERRRMLARQTVERKHLVFQHAKNMQKAQMSKRNALANHEKKLVSNTYTRHGPIAHPDLHGAFRPNWERTRCDSPYLDFISPDIA